MLRDGVEVVDRMPRAPNISVPRAIPMAQAHICINCESIIDQSRVCPVCARTGSIFALGKWLNKKEEVV
jgi:hypothetical protein